MRRLFESSRLDAPSAGQRLSTSLRFAIVLVVIFSDYIGRAFATTLWPLLGFLFMPLTTLAYAFAINSRGSVQGMYLVIVVVAVLIDLGLIGGSASRRSRVRA